MKLINLMNYNFIYTLLLFLLNFSPSISSPLKGYNVRLFGAKNDGTADTTWAFQKIWNAACASAVPSQIYVPSGNYLLGPITFEGPCKSSILFQIDGILIAESNTYDNWIVFHNVDGLHIKGGVLDAKGNSLWECKLSHKNCPMGATSLSIDNSKNIIIDGLTSTNSQMFHMTINACENINMGGLKITADWNSPNTDGIHIERSNGITIKNSQIKTGDDCISIGPYNQQIWIESVFCGPGHGISIGSLGRDKSDEGMVVQNVTVKSVTFSGTDNGLRIKTYSSPIKGFVKDIFFLGATMTNVRNPIIIDQNYCPQGNCVDKGSGIQISNVVYKSIYGSSSSPDILTFDCSYEKPCYGLTLQDIKLYPQSNSPKCECKNCYVKVAGYIQPSHCL